MEETKQSWNKGGAELLSCCEDPDMPPSDILPLPTFTLGAHQMMVSASVFPTSWAASVTNQPQATSFYPWIIIFMKPSMQSPFPALHPWYVVGFLGVVLRGDPCSGGRGAKAEERSPWSRARAALQQEDTKQVPWPSSVHPCSSWTQLLTVAATARCDLQSCPHCSSSVGWSSMN